MQCFPCRGDTEGGDMTNDHVRVGCHFPGNHPHKLKKKILRVCGNNRSDGYINVLRCRGLTFPLNRPRATSKTSSSKINMARHRGTQSFSALTLPATGCRAFSTALLSAAARWTTARHGDEFSVCPLRWWWREGFVNIWRVLLLVMGTSLTGMCAIRFTNKRHPCGVYSLPLD